MRNWDQSPEWERRFDSLVLLVAQRRLSQARAEAKKIRTWQGRLGFAFANHGWHRAELLWLEGVALERGRQRQLAKAVWGRLLALARKERVNPEWLLPRCNHCATRRLPFAPSWRQVASGLEFVIQNDMAATEYLASAARSGAGDA